MVLGIDERIDGVNLGNWLVLEKWMDPKPFTRSAEDDEIWMHRTHVSLWSERNLAEELRRHRETYITLEDFRIIGRSRNQPRTHSHTVFHLRRLARASGLHHVPRPRVPLGAGDGIEDYD